MASGGARTGILFCTTASIALVLMSGTAWVAAPVSATTAMHVSRPAVDSKELLKQFRDLDDLISAAIREFGRGDVKGGKSSIVEAKKLKHSIIKKLYTGTILGLSFDYWYTKLECLDTHLLDFDGGPADTSPDPGLAAARKCAIDLKSQLRVNGAGNRRAVYDGLDKLISGIDAVQKSLKDKDPVLTSKDLAAKARNVKWSIMTDSIGTTLAGVPFWQTFIDLFNVDHFLE